VRELQSRIFGLLIWLAVAALAGGIGWYFVDMNFWVGVGIAMCNLIVNGLIIEWEDNQPGGWNNP
jgi:hypothetical protein